MGLWKRIRNFLGSDADERAYNRIQDMLNRTDTRRRGYSRQDAINDLISDIYDGSFDPDNVRRALEATDPDTDE